MSFRVAILLLLALSLLVNGCAEKRTAIAPEDLENDRQALFDEIRRDSAANAETFVERIKLRVDESDGAPVVINILSLSGGGANGAFGTGLLRGWGTIKTGEFRRPKFDMVTGISTGAFISPFAIEGTDEAYVAIDEYYRNPTDTWVRKQFVAAMIGGKRSVMDAGELWGSLREAISPAVIASVAEERARHRMLLIGTVNADLGIRRIWNVGILAQEATRTKDSTRFHEVVTASGTVPGAFPPVEIDGYLHIDGGIGSIFTCGINAAWLEYAGAKWRSMYGSTRPLPTIRVWIILNGRLQVAPATVQPGWSTMLVRALDISGRVSAQSLLNEMVAGAELMKTRHGWTIEVRYMAIPDTVELPTQESTFDATYMRKLSDVGMQMGADPENWRSKLMARDYPRADALQPEPRESK